MKRYIMDNIRQMIKLRTTEFEDGREIPNTDEELDMFWKGYNELKIRGYLNIFTGVYVGIMEENKDYWEAVVYNENTERGEYIELNLIPKLHVS